MHGRQSATGVAESGALITGTMRDTGKEGWNEQTNKQTNKKPFNSQPSNTAFSVETITCKTTPPLVLYTVVEDWEQGYNRCVAERWLKYFGFIWLKHSNLLT